jgi:hypothetical protein
MSLERKPVQPEGKRTMNLELRVLGDDRVEYGLGDGLYVQCQRNQRTGEVTAGLLQAEAAGERADQIAKRVRLPDDYRTQVLNAAQEHFSAQYQHAAE